jgi:hypothetical protein
MYFQLHNDGSFEQFFVTDNKKVSPYVCGEERETNLPEWKYSQEDSTIEVGGINYYKIYKIKGDTLFLNNQNKDLRPEMWIKRKW